MRLIKEMKTLRFEVFSEESVIHFKSFEDNSRDIELTCIPKIRYFTKKINVVFHHFREYVFKGLTHIQQISVNDQCFDAWTEPLPQNILLKHHKMIFGF